MFKVSFQVVNFIFRSQTFFNWVNKMTICIFWTKVLCRVKIRWLRSTDIDRIFTITGPVHIPPELKLFGELANYITKTEKTPNPNVPEDLAQTNQFLNIYPIRRPTTTTTTSTTTATTIDLETSPEDFYDNLDRRHQNTFPRWQNFPFSAESIQVCNNTQ
jgi:hypothetical protein